MTDIIVSHRNIPSILEAINTTITTYLSDKSDSEQIQWRHTWTKWTSHPTIPFQQITTRNKLAQIILGNDNDKSQTKTILAKMLEAIPVLSDVYEIVQPSRNQAAIFRSKLVSKIQPSSAQTILVPPKETTDNPSDNWSTVVRNKHSSPQRSTKKQAIPVTSVTSSNPFAIFAKEHGEESSTDDTDTKEQPAPTIADDKEQEVTERVKVTEDTDEKFDEQRETEIIEITNSPSNSQKSTESDDNTQNLSTVTETKITELTELINVLHSNDIDIKEVVNWIKNGAAVNYKEAIAVNLTNLVEEGSKVEEKFSMRLQTITNNFIEMLQTEYNVHKTNMDRTTDQLNREIVSTRHSCTSLLNECKGNTNALSKKIETEEASAIIHISNRTNSALKRMDDNIAIVNTKIDELNSAQKFAATHHQELNRLQQHMNATVKTHYEEFSDKINQYADDEKQEFLDFLAHQDDTVAMANSERNLLEEKHRLLDMEKELLETNKSQTDHNNIATVQTKMEITILKDELAHMRRQFDVIEGLKLENENLKQEMLKLHNNMEHVIRTRITESEDTMKDEHRDEIMILHKKITELEEKFNDQSSKQYCQPTNSYSNPKTPHPTFSNSQAQRSNLNSTNATTSQFFEPPLFKIGQEVYYKLSSTQLDGYIAEREYDQHLEMWVYSISTKHGGTMNSCYEVNILSKEAYQSTYATPAPNAKSSTTKYSNLHPPKFEDENGTPRGYDDDTSQSVNEIKLAENQFIYPIGTTNKRSIYYSQISRYADKWKFELKGKHDLFTFYEQLVGLLWEYNILLKPYHEITLDTGIEIITEKNCLNFENGRKAMTTALFNFFDNNKDTVFKDYTEPLSLLPAFRSDNDGLGFLKYILRPIHPNLKDVTDTTENGKPIFKQCPNIHSFINRYKHWLADERILGRPHYTDLEKLKYILHQLDDRFSTAKNKIQTQLNEIYADRLRPGTFPPHLKLDSKSNHLGLTIIELLSPDERSNLENDVPIFQVNKMQTRTNTRPLRDNRRDNRYNSYNNKRREPSTEWAKEIKWRRIPGAVCPACHKTDHNVYETGCANLATFCACQAFVRQHSKEEIKPVLEAYNSFLKELAAKKKNVKQSYRKIIRKLVSKATDDEAIDEIKDDFYQNYIEQFEDEQDKPNPFLDINRDDSADDMDDSEDDVQELEY